MMPAYKRPDLIRHTDAPSAAAAKRPTNDQALRRLVAAQTGRMAQVHAARVCGTGFSQRATNGSPR